MAKLHRNANAAYAGIKFGIPLDEDGTVSGALITHKVNISTKTKKKDLRGRKGGYRAIATFGETVEYSVDAAIDAGGGLGIVLGAVHTKKNDPFTIAGVIFVDSITITEKNDDFKRVSVKMSGSPAMGTPTTTTP